MWKHDNQVLPREAGPHAVRLRRLRNFFLYRDLGIAEATHGQVIAHLVKANMASEAGTGWHRHEADFQIVIMLEGWAGSCTRPGDARAGR